MNANKTVIIREEGHLPAGGLLVRLGAGRRPFTLKRSALAALREALSSWENRPRLRWIAFTAASPTTFLAGADFRELAGMTPWRAMDFARLGQELYKAMRHSPLWLVACVEGACMGGGLDFILACDYRIASPGAAFGHPGPRLGFFTGWGGTASLPTRSGRGKGALLAGSTLDATAACEAGWIEEIAQNPLRRVRTRARNSAPLDLSMIKEIRGLTCRSLSQALCLERISAVTHGTCRDTLSK
jgi:enoyl-CoA hydratase/carnithine racemase